VKERGKPGRPIKEQIAEWLPFLLKEIEIIKPKHIIVLGKGNYERDFKPFIEPRLSNAIKTDWVFHYSTQVPRWKFEPRFREVINRLKYSE
jgi:uracil-DNA glycosylase